LTRLNFIKTIKETRKIIIMNYELIINYELPMAKEIEILIAEINQELKNANSFLTTFLAIVHKSIPRLSRLSNKLLI